VSGSIEPSASRASASSRASSVSTDPSGEITPDVSVKKINFSARNAVATLVASSSIDRLNASPVGENPNGESKTIEPRSIAKRSASTSIFRT
jgi:hypothetical protein